MKEKIKWQLESLQSKEAKDWLKLMIEAKKAGITKEEVRAFILRNKISRT
ncbi:MAG: DNA-binding anti-repressor SinI [Bacillaceae bacterium]|nr:DNA-binding anti-repressor SinI [Bacillaceae bacterium]